jgi:hypothetical protein
MEENSGSNLATKLGIGGGAGAVFLGAGYLFGKGGRGFWIFLLLVLLLLLLLLGGYFLWIYLKRKRQSARFAGEMRQQSAASPRGISDPAKRARLDDLRKKFDEGIIAYRSRGKDLYSLPWCVIVGEPGSGKTEAVRHSNVGFPPGMQDEFQGVGGTINMNWWFTNQAVLLDTAGRLMFEEVKPGETSEWKEFLSLLKKARPSCPINGLLLVIPAESLIKDTADDIQRKAGKIAQQLDVIQRTLDVRFPVFVIITKCDLILGFREFFDGLTDPQLQHQMMGWSNPDPLDSPFRPDEVEKHIDTVVNRLSRRRLGLLRDPVPESDKPDARRIEEVDTLYALPHSLQAIVPRLRRYLETIFIAGEWSAKPLFLRGIYFSSSMREGSALDAELAEAMSVPMEELSDFKVWERDRSYFLRDLFLEKVFRERGLVTRAGNTSAMLRKRKVVLYSCGFAALAIFMAVAWFGMGALKKGVTTHSTIWGAMAREGWDEDRIWKDSIIPKQGRYYKDLVRTERIEVGDLPKMTLGDFHVRLRDVATNQLQAHWWAPGMGTLAARYNAGNLVAHRIAFDTSVIKPLVDAARKKLLAASDLRGDDARRQAEALSVLIKLESDVLNPGLLDEGGVKAFAEPLLTFVAGRDQKLDTNLVAIWSWTYSFSKAGQNKWPMPWLSGQGSNAVPRLSDNTALLAGLGAFKRGLTNSAASQFQEWNQVDDFRKMLAEFEKVEKALAEAVATRNQASIRISYDDLMNARTNLDKWLSNHRTSWLFTNGLSLTNAQAAFARSVAATATGPLDRLWVVNEAALKQNTNSPLSALFKDIRLVLEQAREEGASLVSQRITAKDVEELRRFDAEQLSKAGDNLAYDTRCDLYASIIDLMPVSVTPAAWEPPQKAKPLEDFLNNKLAPVRAACAAYPGSAKDLFNGITGYFLSQVEEAKQKDYFAYYLKQGKAGLAGRVGFPVAQDGTRSMTFKELPALGTFLKFVSDDLKSPLFKKYGVETNENWQAFSAAISNFTGITSALLGQDNLPGKVTVSLAGMLESMPQGKDEWRGPLRRIRLAGAAERLDTNIAADAPIGVVPVDAPLALELSSPDNSLKVTAEVQKTPDWGALWLVLKAGGKPDKTDPRVWLVDWPVKDPGYKGDVRLKLQFDRPLPELKSWPAQQF